MLQVGPLVLLLRIGKPYAHSCSYTLSISANLTAPRSLNRPAPILFLIPIPLGPCPYLPFSNHLQQPLTESRKAKIVLKGLSTQTLFQKHRPQRLAQAVLVVRISMQESHRSFTDKLHCQHLPFRICLISRSVVATMCVVGSLHVNHQHRAMTCCMCSSIMCTIYLVYHLVHHLSCVYMLYSSPQQAWPCITLPACTHCHCGLLPF